VKGLIKALYKAIRKSYKPIRLFITFRQRVEIPLLCVSKSVDKVELECSMKQSCDPYVNAIIERVYGILKAEFIGYTPHIN
jgi:transposase InsO family protein